MSRKKKLNKSGTILVVLLIAIIAAAGIYIYKNTVSTPKVSFDGIVATDGLTMVGKEIVVSIGGAGTSNMTLVVSEGKGLLVDTGYSKNEAERVKEYLNKNKITLDSIVLTHMHNDHIANLGMFKTDSVKLYKPTDLKDGQEITVGRKHFRILKTDGHTPKGTHVSVEIVEDNVLIAGDVLITDGLPAVGASYKDLISSLKKIDSKGYAVIIPGHGAIADSRAAVAKNLEYLENASKKVEELIKSGGVLPQIESISIEDCVSGVSSLNEELLKEIHRFNMINIYQQVKMELEK